MHSNRLPGAAHYSREVPRNERFLDSLKDGSAWPGIGSRLSGPPVTGGGLMPLLRAEHCSR